MTSIAFQGRHGAYGESATLHLFGKNITTVPVDSFDDVYRLVESGAVDGGVIPIENSTAGSINDNYDLLLQWKLPIVSEVKLHIEHCLMALPGTRIEDLHEVISHPQALAQCSDFFKANPKIKRTAFFDTAGSGEEIATKKLAGVGGIASAFAAEYYGLSVLKYPLANQPGANFTRFFAIQKKAPTIDASMHTKSSLAFAPQQNIAGILYKCLGCFATRNIDLVRIESRPQAGSPWQYVFYLDYLGNPAQPHVQAAIAELETISNFVISLGSYINGEDCAVEF